MAGRTETRRGTKQRSNSRRPSAACSCASLATLLLASLLTSLSTPASVVFQNVAAAAATNAARFVVLIFKNISLKYISMYVEKIRRYINIYLLRCVPGCQCICLCVCVYLFKFVRRAQLWAPHLNMIIIIIFVIFALIISPQFPSMSKPMYMAAHMSLCVLVCVCACGCVCVHANTFV